MAAFIYAVPSLLRTADAFVLVVLRMPGVMRHSIWILVYVGRELSDLLARSF